MARRSSCEHDDLMCPNRIDALEQSIRGEAEAVVFYNILMEMAPTSEQKDTIVHIRNDERRHLNNFQNVYRKLTGKYYIYPEPQVIPPANYCQGLQDAFADEQEAYEYYKLNYFCNSNPAVRTAFQDAMLDEAEHARWFNNLLIRNDCD